MVLGEVAFLQNNLFGVPDLGRFFFCFPAIAFSPFGTPLSKWNIGNILLLHFYYTPPLSRLQGGSLDCDNQASGAKSVSGIKLSRNCQMGISSWVCPVQFSALQYADLHIKEGLTQIHIGSKVTYFFPFGEVLQVSPKPM